MLPHYEGMVVLCTHARQGVAALEAIPKSEVAKEEPVRMAADPSTKAAISIGIAVLVSRILGLVREMVMSRYFGAGLATDAFNVAHRIPNLLRDLFAEGVLSAAFVPTFVRSLALHGKEQAWLLANRVISALLLILGAITLAFFFGARGFVYLLASGFFSNPEKLQLTVAMTRILSPFLLFISLASVLMGLLNARGSFFVPAMASSAFNVCSILAGVFLSPLMPQFGLDPIVSMAIGGLIGGASQLFVMVPSAYATGFRFRFSLDFSDSGLRHVAQLMIPAIVGLSATQINITVDSQIASGYGNGPMSWLNYAFRLMQFPIGIFGIAIATSTMTTISYHAAQGAKDKLHQRLSASLRFAACLTFPATVGLIIFRQEIVRLLYEGGSFLPVHTVKTSQIVLLYALGLFSYSAVKILVPVFYALNDSKIPVKVSMITVAVKIALNFALAIPLKFFGLALATSLASWLNCALLLNHLHQKTGIRWQKKDLSVYVRIALASMIMGALALLVFKVLEALLPGSSTLLDGFKLGTAILTALVSLIPLLQMFGIEEGKELYRMAGNFIKKFL
jgi:putative peptidoglycan lipid II flippase